MSYRRCFYALLLLALIPMMVTGRSHGQTPIGGGGCEDGCDPPPPPPPPPPPDLTFNAVFYESIYPDIESVYGNNLQAATQHYYLFGLPTGRRGGIIFDPVYYLQRYPDLLQAFGATGYQAAANHFI